MLPTRRSVFFSSRFLTNSYHGEKIPSFSLNDRVRWTDVEDAIVRSMADDFEPRTRGFLEDFYRRERFTEIGLEFLWLFEVLI